MFTIKEVSVAPGETVEASDVKKIVEEKLVGNHFAFIPKHFTWTYPEEEIEEAISNIPKVAAVEVELDSDKVLNISYREYGPKALWCGESTCVFIDKHGYAFAEAPNLNGGAMVRFSERGVEPELKQMAFSEDFINSSFALIQAAYNNLGFNIIAVEKIADSEAIYQISGGGQIKVSLQQSMDQTLNNFSTIINSRDYSHLAPGNFEYIDLRYGNKVFIMEEEPVATSTDQVTATSTEQEH